MGNSNKKETFSHISSLVDRFIYIGTAMFLFSLSHGCLSLKIISGFILIINIIVMGRIINLQGQGKSDHKDCPLRVLVGIGMILILCWVILGILF